jgi:hypothetical protein
MNEEEMECWGSGVMEYWGIVEENLRARTILSIVTSMVLIGRFH